MRLTLVISSLAIGGAERVMSNLANYWANNHYEVCLLTLDDGAKAPAYPLDPRIDHITLGLARKSPNLLAAIWHNLGRVMKLRSAIRESSPDCVISFIDQVNVLTLLATLGTKIPVVVSERSDPYSHRIGRAWEWLRRFAFERANRVIAPTAFILSRFSRSIQSRGQVIPNPVLASGTTWKADSHKSDARSLVSVGRMGREKGFDLLLEAFARVRQLHRSWILTIVGDGLLRQDLESLRDRLGLTECVKLVGQVDNPEVYLRKADLFVMASRYEGFPNALCEAMACGLPVIHTDCPSGPREIIRDGIDGVLVPNEDVDSLAAAMGRLMSDAGERQRLALRAGEVTERFSVSSVMNKWEELLRQTVKQRAS